MWKLGVPDTVGTPGITQDGQVAATAIRNGNFDYATTSVRWDHAPAAIPDSLYLGASRVLRQQPLALGGSHGNDQASYPPRQGAFRCGDGHGYGTASRTRNNRARGSVGGRWRLGLAQARWTPAYDEKSLPCAGLPVQYAGFSLVGRRPRCRAGRSSSSGSRTSPQRRAIEGPTVPALAVELARRWCSVIDASRSWT